MLSVSGLNKSFGQNLVISNFCHNFDSKKIYGLKGKNGSGKTTLLKILAGLITQDSGKIDTNLNNLKLFSSYIDNNPRSFFQRLSVKENLAFFGSLNGMTPNEVYDDFQFYRNYFDISELFDKPVNKLSLGQNQIISIIRGLQSKPLIVFYDEVLSSLDKQNKANLFELINAQKNDLDSTHIIATHDDDILKNIAEELIIL
tara:strand:- start:5 stop:607 length:603 start_codon:yes stop_codon:yes gene_type:complete